MKIANTSAHFDTLWYRISDRSGGLSVSACYTPVSFDARGLDDLGFSKYSILVLLAVALIAVLWRFGRTVFAGVTKWVLRALAALCACAGLVAVLSSEGQPLLIVGGIILWVFAAYTIKVAGASRRRSVRLQEGHRDQK